MMIPRAICALFVFSGLFLFPPHALAQQGQLVGNKGCSKGSESECKPRNFRVVAISDKYVKVAWDYFGMSEQVLGFEVGHNGQTTSVGSDAREFVFDLNHGFYIDSAGSSTFTVATKLAKNKTKPESIKVDMSSFVFLPSLPNFKAVKKSEKVVQLSWDKPATDLDKVVIVREQVYPSQKHAIQEYEAPKGETSMILKDLPSGVHKFHARASKGLMENETHRKALALKKQHVSEDEIIWRRDYDSSNHGNDERKSGFGIGSCFGVGIGPFGFMKCK